MMQSNVVSLDDARVAAMPKVYSCGKCDEQGAILLGDGVIVCGGHGCTARMAALWYAPTDATTIAKFTRPRVRVVGKESTFGNAVETQVRYYCHHCGFGYWHMQQDHTFTCYNVKCKRPPLFRWVWQDQLGGV